MKKIFKNNFNNFLTGLLIFLVITSWIFSGWPQIFKFPPEIQKARAAVPVVESVTETESGDNVTTFTINMPVTRPNGDLYIAIIGKDDDIVIAGVPANWTEIYNITDEQNGCSIGAWWWEGDSEPATYDVTGDNEEYSGAILRISGADTTNPIHTTSTVFNNSINPTAPSVTPTIDDTIILYAAVIDTDIWDTTDPYPAGTTGQFAINSATGGGNSSGNTAGATKTGIKDSDSGTGVFTAAATDSWVAITIAIAPTAPIITTLADGTDPNNSAIAPGTSILDLDAFRLIASSGTDSVTAATVTLAAGTYASLSEVKITSSDGTTLYFSAVANPASDIVNFSAGTAIPVTTTETTFKIRITPKIHADMPAPVGSEYAVTGTITSFTSTNTQAGTDTDSATITIDNLSPDNTTSNSGTAGNAEVTINYTTPANSDLHSVIILRDTSVVTDNPVEGITYTVGNTIGTAEIACVDTTVSVSTADSCVDTNVVNGIAYYYKIFVKDSNGNYSTGAVPAESPFTPASNSAPSISSLSLNSGSNIILNEGTYRWATSTMTITDADGCDTVSSVTATLYRADISTSGTTCAGNDNNCYINTWYNSCVATTTGNTCGASPDTTGEFDCGFKIWHIADPTDAGTYVDDIWSVSATTTDSASATGNATNTAETIEIISLNALNVTSSIDYGTVDANSNTDAFNQTTTVTTTGNTAIDTELSGTDMTGAGTIAVANQKYGLSDVTYESLTSALSGSAVSLKLDNIKPTSTTTPQTDIIYWGLAAPAGSPIGSYSGTNTFSAISD